MATNPTSKPKPAEKLTRDAPCPVSTTEAMKKKILVVDDDPQIRESLRKVLRAEGYEVVLAADGRDGIEKFNTERIDLLLLDLNLPGNSGWDIFGTLTSLNPFLPIIIITGRQNQHELVAGAGVGALMEKPLDVPLLLKTITELLAESAETRLKRLVGLHSDMCYVPPPHPISPNVMS
jgi:DNA-binding response OmpR family regulator